MVHILRSFLSHFTANCMNMMIDCESGYEESIQNTTTKLEFAVNMTCGSCENAVRESLKDIRGIRSLEIDVSSQRVILNTTEPSNIIQDALESTGMLAVLKGHGATHLGAAVSILRDNGIIKGLVRFTQVEERRCVIDGSFSGLTPGKHALHIHELGDLSDGWSSTGGCYNPFDTNHGDRLNKSRHVGDLGNIEVNGKGDSNLRYVDDLIKVSDIIGRSVVVHENPDDYTTDDHGAAGRGVACGIVARSSGLFQNKKMVCSCSGQTIWEEREDAKQQQQHASKI